MLCRKNTYLSLLETTTVYAQWCYFRIHSLFALKHIFFLPTFAYCLYHRCFLSFWEAFHNQDDQFSLSSLFLLLKAIPFYSDNDILLFYKVSKQQTLTLAINEYLFVFYNILMRLINLWLTGVVTLYSSSESLEYDFWYPVRKANTICLGNVPKYSILQKVTRDILLI